MGLKMHIKCERIYAKQQSKGIRILVDRVWPRGVSKENANLDYWLKDIAPSPTLRKWFNHDPNKFEEFKASYLKELESNDAQKTEVQNIQDILKNNNNDLLLLYGAKDETYNHAVVLRSFLEERLSQ